mgnify:CR=1 FL=1
MAAIPRDLVVLRADEGRGLLGRDRGLRSRLGLEHDLERIRLGGGGERLVGRHRFTEREAVGRERRRVQAPLRAAFATLGALE